MSRFLVILGLLITGIGLVYPLIQRLGVGNLPGDIYIEKGVLFSDHYCNFDKLYNKPRYTTNE
nr:DUF2905 domain-containing protein [Wolbachia endosymbiont (group A) of Sicus ferrugineus]